MPAPKWTTPEQLAFLMEEDKKWLNVKAGTSSLTSFYICTAITFLDKWPVEPDAELLAKAGGDITKAKELVQNQYVGRVSNWFSNRHHPSKSNPPAPESLLDLSGKNSRKRPPLQPWQAFSVLYYRPEDSPLCIEVRSLFEKRGDPAAVGFLTDFLPSDGKTGTVDYLVFLSAYLRERCTRLSREEEQKVQAYIDEQESLAMELQDRPWSLDNDDKGDPLLAENKYVQRRIDELPRVAQRALDEIEKATGFKGLLLVGSLTPAKAGTITTHVYTTRKAVATGLTFVQSWGGYCDLHATFVKWLQLAYSEEDKSRRECFSASCPTGDSNGLASHGSPRSSPTTPDPWTNIPPTPPTDKSMTPMTDLLSMPPTDIQPTPTTNTSPTPPPEVLASEPPIPEQTQTTTPVAEVAPESPRTSSPSPGALPPVIPPPTILATPPGTQTAILEHDPSYPGFITMAVVEHLKSADDGRSWTDMVKSYLELESKYHRRRPGRISLQCRPQEVVKWGHQPTSMPSIDDVSQFQEKWVAWWSNSQPKWRSIEVWPFPHDEGKDKDWARLNITGPHGLFAFVISASWWAASTNLDSHRTSLNAAVADLHWVIENLIHFNSQSQVTQSEATPVLGSKFPSHDSRGSGKRQIKPSLKASYLA